MLEFGKGRFARGRGDDLARERQWCAEGRATNQGLGLLDMLTTKEELSIEITQIDSVKVDNVNLAESGQDEVFE